MVANKTLGRCRIENIAIENVLSPDECPSPLQRIQLLIAGEVIIASSLDADRRPYLLVHRSLQSPQILKSYKIPPTQLSHITCLAQDQSSGTEIKIAAFYGTGAVSIFLYQTVVALHSSELDVYVPPIRSERTSPITLAAYYHPLLVTLSASFQLSIYRVADGSITHKQTLSSFTSYSPNSLVLTSPSVDSYRLFLAYSVPIYPEHWGVAVTEITIASNSAVVSASKTRRAFDVPFGWLDEHKLRSLREQWDRKVMKVTATETDGKWVVFAGSANTIQVYRVLKRPAPGQLAFVRSLHGHLGRIHSIALSDGRCVSVGVDGSVWVWDLEMDWGAEVKRGTGDVTLAGKVVFDERRILCVKDGQLEISHFDI